MFWFFIDEESRSLNDGTQIHFLICFYVCRLYKYFLGFSGKTSSSVFVHSRAHKSMRMKPSILLSSFCTRHGSTKNETRGVSFKLFSHSIKTKRVPSDLVLFTLVKVFEENVCWVVDYLFFGLIKLTYEKIPYGVLFKCFSESLKMKRLSSDLVLFMLVKLFE